MTSWTSVSVGVADLDEALNLWSGSFGLEVKAQKDGNDPELARLWGLAPDDIQRQALVGTPGVNTGLMHFVQFKNPGPAVREQAQAFDLCPKNLDIYVRRSGFSCCSISHKVCLSSMMASEYCSS